MNGVSALVCQVMPGDTPGKGGFHFLSPWGKLRLIIAVGLVSISVQPILVRGQLHLGDTARLVGGCREHLPGLGLRGTGRRRRQRVASPGRLAGFYRLAPGLLSPARRWAASGSAHDQACSLAI